MKKFKFSLEKVLEVKEIEEKNIQRRLQKVQSLIFETEKNIFSVSEKISSEGKKVNSMINNIMKSTDIMIHYKYIESLCDQLNSLKAHLRDLRVDEEQITTELIEKSKEKKAIEKLKEIKYEEYRKEYNKEQQTILDEISIQSHRLKVGSVS